MPGGSTARWGGDVQHLPATFVHALQIHPRDHLAMMQSVQPWVDGAIAKTVPVAPDVSFEDFRDLYLNAWSAGLKGLTAYRANPAVGAVCAPLCDQGLP